MSGIENTLICKRIGVQNSGVYTQTGRTVIENTFVFTRTGTERTFIYTRTCTENVLLYTRTAKENTFIDVDIGKGGGVGVETSATRNLV